MLSGARYYNLSCRRRPPSGIFDRMTDSAVGIMCISSLLPLLVRLHDQTTGGVSNKQKVGGIAFSSASASVSVSPSPSPSALAAVDTQLLYAQPFPSPPPPIPPPHTSPLPKKQSIRKPEPGRPIAQLPNLVLAQARHLALLVAPRPPRIHPHEIQRHAPVQRAREGD